MITLTMITTTPTTITPGGAMRCRGCARLRPVASEIGAPDPNWSPR